MDVVFLGTNNAGLEIYEWLCARKSVDVLALLTTEDQLDLIQKLRPDIVVACGFQHIVPPQILEVPEEGCINIHPGLLPHTRGFNPNVWSIVEGHPPGVTIHYMDEGIDTGKIVATGEVDSSFEDTGRDLYERLEEACVDLFRETWPLIQSGEASATEQDDDEATYHRKRDFEALCELDPDEEYSVRELLDILRALTFPPFDNASIEINGERYYVDIDIRHESEARSQDSVGMLSSY